MDYLPTSGTLKLYPNENQAVIPAGIIGGHMPKPSEDFYPDVFNPEGGRFWERRKFAQLPVSTVVACCYIPKWDYN